jgi:hypothetical protein
MSACPVPIEKQFRQVNIAGHFSDWTQVCFFFKESSNDKKELS